MAHMSNFVGVIGLRGWVSNVVVDKLYAIKTLSKYASILWLIFCSEDN
jgi:hypothetical protein